MAGLRIAPGLTLPLDAVTQTFGILAKKRAGKSNAAVVLAEEMYDAGLPWVAIDPKGDWWGVRAAGDGKAEGLSVLVFGGLHGDVPLEPTSGSLVADLVAHERITCVLDVSEMTKADQRRFLTDFASRLYRTNREPLHVFCEEADEYIPQRVMGESAKLVGAFESLVKRGGFRGIGITLITQRSASLNKDVLTQVETLVCLRTTSPQDRKAILAWMDFHDAGKETVDALPGLKDGEAYVFSPSWLDMLTKVRFRRRRTYDSGATPKVGGKPKPPARLADVDIDAIKVAMADTIEKAEANDPRVLRERIQMLEAENRRLNQVITEQRDQVEQVEVKVPDKEVLREVLDEVNAASARWEVAKRELEEATFQMASAWRATDGTLLKHLDGEVRKMPPGTVRKEDVTSVEPSAIDAERLHQEVSMGRRDPTLSKAERKILTVLGQQGPKMHTQIAVLSGYSHKSGGFKNALSSLRTKGYIEGGRGSQIAITGLGRNALGAYDVLPTGRDLLEWWKENHLSKAEKAIVDVLVLGGFFSAQELADRTGYTVTSGGFKNAMSRLRTLEVASGRGGLELNPELL